MILIEISIEWYFVPAIFNRNFFNCSYNWMMFNCLFKQLNFNQFSDWKNLNQLFNRINIHYQSFKFSRFFNGMIFKRWCINWMNFDSIIQSWELFMHIYVWLKTYKLSRTLYELTGDLWNNLDKFLWFDNLFAHYKNIWLRARNSCSVCSQFTSNISNQFRQNCVF